ncbi:HD domain-containing protein [Clostridium sp. C8-1-8]|uniref:HD domain-containing protein n=1 Tax=Clostridium sp. C8-1-8 TaxID=2698831 RepID=UPI001370E5F7|nr:HD domain-containing protein [Clostridium sp. C8-1-8]
MENNIEKNQKYLHNGSDEAMDNRIERLRKYIDEILLNMKDAEERRCGYLHLYGVSQACAMIALKRNQDVELATMAGMLHDLHSYKTMNTENHAEHGAVLARQILEELSLTTDNETELICSAICNHSSKATTDSALDEILKDADVLQHCLYNPLFPVMEHEKCRFQNLLTEFGILRTL